MMRVFLVDDEPLSDSAFEPSFKRNKFGVQIVGQETDAQIALEKLNSLDKNSLDALFLDVQMPELNGFELLAKLDWQPLVVFATAYDQYALQAFEVHSIDYLLKPIEPEKLERALGKLERFLATDQPAPDLQADDSANGGFLGNERKKIFQLESLPNSVKKSDSSNSRKSHIFMPKIN
ncbi:MAG: response regulator [Pyrinomonadaceae bacterium]